MKKFKQLFTFFLLGISYLQMNAQVAPLVEKVLEPRTYWQLSSRVGYDFPTYKEDFKYIDYKGGFMGGLSLNHYWKNWGFQVDFDYIKNAPKSTLPNPLPYLTAIVSNLDVNVQSVGITRMFLGVGPAYKYQSQSNKWTTEAAVMGGIGFINGGEILAQGSNPNVVGHAGLGSPVLLSYHSGFDHVKAVSLKAQIRETYWFHGGKWGVNVGAYYMNHFGVNESKVNPLLISNGYIANNNTSNLYYYQMGTLTSPGLNNGEPVFNFQVNETRQNIDTEDQRQKIKLSSVGVFAGLSYRLYPKKHEKVEKPVIVTEAPVAKKYCLQVTAKDKYTGEVIPNTDVALTNSKGEVVSTAKTDAFGVTKFCDILPDDYKIKGIYNEVALDEAAANKSEFKDDLTLKKEVLYSDRDFIIKGKAVVCNTTTPIESLSVVLEKDDKSYKKVDLTDAKGEFNIKLPVLGVYTLFGRKSGYFSQTETIDASNYNRDKTLFVKLDICAEEADCGKAIGLKNILFDLDKFFIREDAKPELNKLVRFMLDNPDVKVEVGSHTDCRSSFKYNQKLSQNRANASVDYVVSQGVPRANITGKGYGESVLLNECADGVKCPEDKHQINRRTEFKVICPPKK